MKKVLSAAIAIMMAASVASAATYTETAASKLITPIAKKEAAQRAKVDKAQKDYQAKKESLVKAQKAQEEKAKAQKEKLKQQQEKLKKQQEQNKKKVETKKKQLKDLTTF